MKNYYAIVDYAIKFRLICIDKINERCTLQEDHVEILNGRYYPRKHLKTIHYYDPAKWRLSNWVTKGHYLWDKYDNINN